MAYQANGNAATAHATSVTLTMMWSRAEPPGVPRVVWVTSAHRHHAQRSVFRNRAGMACVRFPTQSPAARDTDLSWFEREGFTISRPMR